MIDNPHAQGFITLSTVFTKYDTVNGLPKHLYLYKAFLKLFLTLYVLLKILLRQYVKQRISLPKMFYQSFIQNLFMKGFQKISKGLQAYFTKG